MDKTTKQILIDLVEYHKGKLYTPDAFGMTLEDIATRAVAVLAQENQRSKRPAVSVDPFAMDVVAPHPQMKKETDW